MMMDHASGVSPVFAQLSLKGAKIAKEETKPPLPSLRRPQGLGGYYPRWGQGALPCQTFRHRLIDKGAEPTRSLP